MAPFEPLYGRRYRSPIGWYKEGEMQIFGPDLVHQVMEDVKIIRERLNIAQSRHKSYANVRKRDLKFEVGDWIFLRVSPMKRVMHFGKKVLPIEEIKMNNSLSYEEELVAILDRQVRKLRSKEIASVKVQW
ncbi:uncharacterized protein LOC124899222 [Capsicum annuum]|uniref:uncharacterized protein LOC124899222 n=1 Tax=Capsicum annuum TaxID=4072 RepID=UPI001FB0CD1C|nr:uncharacterized protein LOC124899222 [Capsicum annuum]